MAFLTIERRGGKRGQGLEAAGTKAAQEEGTGRKRVTALGRACQRSCSLSVPFGTGEARSAGGRSRESAFARLNGLRL
jgi:hypothetical protein